MQLTEVHILTRASTGARRSPGCFTGVQTPLQQPRALPSVRARPRTVRLSGEPENDWLYRALWAGAQSALQAGSLRAWVKRGSAVLLRPAGRELQREARAGRVTSLCSNHPGAQSVCTLCNRAL